MQRLLLFTCCHPKNARSNQDCGSCSKRQENKGWFSWLLAHWGLFPLPAEYPDYPEHFVLSTLFHFSTACCKKPKADSRSSCGEKTTKLEAVAALGVKKWGWTWNAPIDNLCSTAHLNSSEFNPSIPQHQKFLATQYSCRYHGMVLAPAKYFGLEPRFFLTLLRFGVTEESVPTRESRQRYFFCTA